MRSIMKRIQSRFGKPITLPDGSVHICNIAAILRNVKTGRERVIYGANIVTNDGDRMYATKGAGESAYFTPAGLRLGTNAGIPSAPQKADVKLQTTTGSAVLSGSPKAFDSTYPKSNDGDSDNTGAGVKVVTYRVSYATTDANGVGIASLDLPDSLTDGSITKSVAVANFSVKFDKTSSDTLKVFVNHSFAGV